MANFEIDFKQVNENNDKTESNMNSQIEMNKRQIIVNSEPSFPEFISPKYRARFAASDVAALIGKNRYKTRSQALYAHLKKDLTFNKKINEIKSKVNNNKETLINTYLSKYHFEIRKMVDDSVNIVDSNQLQTHIQTCMSTVMGSVQQPENQVPIDVSKRIANEVKSKICKERGLHLEKPSIEQFQIDANLTISNCNKEFYESDCGTYSLCGMVDGIDETGECVIEIKNRTRNLNYLPEYDVIQCIIYMKLTKLKKCKLVEFYPDRTFRVTNIDWNEDKFRDIDNALSNLVNDIRNFTHVELAKIIEENDFDSSK